MKHYGVASWKPTCLWSNSYHVKDLDPGPLTPAMRANSVALAMTYRDARGVKRCVGKKKILKDSQILDCTCWPNSGPLSLDSGFYNSEVKTETLGIIFCKKRDGCVFGLLQFMIISGPTPKLMGTRLPVSFSRCMMEFGVCGNHRTECHQDFFWKPEEFGGT